MEKKECAKCNKNLDITNFYRDYTVTTKVSFRSKCKICCSKQTAERKKHNKDEKINIKVCNNSGGCGGGEKPISEFFKSTRHKDGYFNFCKECHKFKCENKGNNPKIKRTPEYMKIYNKKKYGTPENKIKYSIRKSLLTYINKDNRTIKYLGCSTKFFRFWIESQFEDEMTWDNHGSLWHFDHVNPCNNFDLKNETDIFKCYNWSNFRPYDKTKNILKSDTVDLNLIKNHTKLKNRFLKKYKNSISNINNHYNLNTSTAPCGESPHSLKKEIDI
jgi:hypothetical protein